MQARTIRLLACPSCHAGLTADAANGEIVEAVLACGCGRAYPVRDGVAVLISGETEDVWRDASSRLDEALDADPAVRRRLLDAPLEELNGADQTFRGMVLEARGELEAAEAAFAAAHPALYGAEQRACTDRLLDACVARTAGAPWVVDVASGRGALVERLARAGFRVLATDISPVAMVRLRARLIGLGLGGRVDCIACDAAALPFGDGRVPAVTSHLGLQNIANPEGALRELRRVSHGPMRLVGHAYPADDVTNGDALRQLGYAHVADRSVLETLLADAGWTATFPEVCHASGAPTPVGEVIDGGVVDGFPVAPTTLSWYLLEARPGG